MTIAAAMFAAALSVRILSPAADSFVSGSDRAARAGGTRGRGGRSCRSSSTADRCARVARAPYECEWDAGRAIVEHRIRVVAASADGTGGARGRDDLHKGHRRRGVGRCRPRRSHGDRHRWRKQIRDGAAAAGLPCLRGRPFADDHAFLVGKRRARSRARRRHQRQHARVDAEDEDRRQGVPDGRVGRAIA